MNRNHGWLVHRYDRLTSTMDVAALLARFGARDRTVIVSPEQTAGRGRGGKSWHAPPGEAVCCTLLLRPPLTPGRLSTLPLVAGVAVAETIEQATGVRASLKWPNDVWIGDHQDRCKVAGILTTSSFTSGQVNHVLVGIGINVTSSHNVLPPGATSLVAATGASLTIETVFSTMLDQFARRYEEYLGAAGRPSLSAWVARAALLGETVTIEDAGRQWTGIFIGIDDSGALLLQEPDKTVRKLMAGDLTRGPRALSQLE